MALGRRFQTGFYNPYNRRDADPAPILSFEVTQIVNTPTPVGSWRR
jgi:hypothetical protein